MEKILTKQEIEALLAAVFEGKIEPDKELAKAEGVVHAYDLFNNETKGNIPSLDIIYDSFIRYQRGTLSNRLGRIVEIKKMGAAAYKFDDFLHTLPSPVAMAIYKADPLKGAALVAFDSALVFTIVDCILGGTGSSAVPMTGNRMFTSIELRLVQKIMQDILADLEKAWSPIYATKMSLMRMEMNPRLVNIVPPEYQVLTMELQIQIEEIIGKMVFAVPLTTIDPVRDKLKTGAQVDMMAVDPQWSFRLSSGLLEAPLDLSVEVGGATISLDDLLSLAPGDTIMLETPCTSDLVVKVGGVPKFMSAPGLRHGNKAAQITTILGKGREQ